MTPPDVKDCALCHGHEFKFSVCGEHLAKIRDGFLTAGAVLVDRAVLVKVREALKEWLEHGVHVHDMPASYGEDTDASDRATMTALDALDEALK